MIMWIFNLKKKDKNGEQTVSISTRASVGSLKHRLKLTEPIRTGCMLMFIVNIFVLARGLLFLLNVFGGGGRGIALWTRFLLYVAHR